MTGPRPLTGGLLGSPRTRSRSTTTSTRPRSSCPGIGKRFPGVIANHDVDITIRAGTVHALVGENGAGKSTLMKILYGVQKPDDGTIRINGEPGHVQVARPTRSTHGIGMVFQHFMLADNLTVLENVVLGRGEAATASATRPATSSARSPTSYGFGLDPDVLVERLGVGDRQRVEILKVLYRGAKVIILDEPTAVLVPQEVDALFENLRDLKPQGHTDPLHLPQARRGARHRRRHHRDAPRHDGRLGQARPRSPSASSPR